MSESDVEQVVAPIYKTFTNPRTTILGAPGPGRAAPHRRGRRRRRRREERIEALAVGDPRARCPGRVFSEDGRELQEVVAALLVERGLTPGPRRVVHRAACSPRASPRCRGRAVPRPRARHLRERAKVEQLGVDPALLERHGRGSEEVAAAMAAAARARGRGRTSAWPSPASPGPAAAREEKPVGPRLHRPGRRRGRPRAALLLPRRARRACGARPTQAALEMMRRGLLGLARAVSEGDR